MNNKNKETKMDTTRMTFGTMRINYGPHSLTVGLGLPLFLAQALDGQEPPVEWDDAITNHLFARASKESDWSARFEFGYFNEQQAKGQTGRKRAGQLPKKPGLAKGKKDAAVRGRPGRGIGGRGVRELSLSYRGQKMPTGNAGKMALSGYVGRTTRKGAVSLVSAKW